MTIYFHASVSRGSITNRNSFSIRCSRWMLSGDWASSKRFAAVSVLCKAGCFPTLPERDFQTWVSNRFGRRLFKTFFESYTEKVWGMDCREIAAEWAAQRIQGLSLWSLMRDALFQRSDKHIKTLIKDFQYPRLGPGMLWSRMREIVEQRGVRVILNAPVESVQLQSGRVVPCKREGRGLRRPALHQ